MGKACHLHNEVVNLLQKLNWLPVLLARISIGSIFVLSGWGKIHDLDKVVGYFTSLGIPFPELNAQMVSVVELGCGTLVLLGLFTRLASVPLMGTMLVAILTAKRADIGGALDLVALDEYIYLVILLWFVISGPGKVSVDHFAAKRCDKRN